MVTSAYIDLLKKNLCGFFSIGSYEYHLIGNLKPNRKIRMLVPFDSLLQKRNFAIVKKKYVTEAERLNGKDWPSQALTMIGMKRLTNIEFCIHEIIKNEIPGDFIETGVWRGGAGILMRALLKEMEITDKKVWMADSFNGVPHPDIKNYPDDKKVDLHLYKMLSVSLPEVKDNFSKYNLLDDQVQFLQGWFKDTLPNSPVEKLSLLRLDGDLYESTWLALQHLYPKLAAGGFIIIDDYHAFPFCKKAVDNYRNENNITDRIIDIDQEAVYWRKTI